MANEALGYRVAALEVRLRTAEATSRRLRSWCIAVAAGCLLLVAGTAFGQKAKPIKVTQFTAPFQVIDPQGRVLLTVEPGRPGPLLRLYGSSGKPTVRLGMSQQGGGRLEVFDRTGKVGFVTPK